MRDSDWSRPNLLRSDWLPIIVAPMTTNLLHRICSKFAIIEAIKEAGYKFHERFLKRKTAPGTKKYKEK